MPANEKKSAKHTALTREAAKAFLEANQIKFVLAQFVDIHGVAKTKAVPVEHFEDIILEDGAGFAGFALWGMGQEPHDPDYMAIGDLATLTLMPWQPGYARIVCDGRVKGKPWPFDSRFVLKEQVRRLSERGWTSEFRDGAGIHALWPPSRRFHCSGR